MKKLFFIVLFISSTIGFAQNNYIVKTEDGRRVLLKSDFTWEYIDAASPNTVTSPVKKEISKKGGCHISSDFKEPKLNSKIQSQLKKSRSTITHVKKKVAKKHNCKLEEVVLLDVSETKQNGRYEFCANGTKVTYKRFGSSITEAKKLF